MNKKITRVGLESLGKLHWYHWLVVASSLALTLSAWYITSLQVKQKTEIQFNFQADQIVQLTRERMAKYEDALLGGVATMQAQSNETNPDHWRVFSASLSISERYPGINGIGVIYYIAPSQLDSYLAKERISRPDYNIHPPHQQQEYWPITYIEPVSVNKKAVGLDMAHESNRLSAAKKARDTGTTQITAPIILVQDARKTPGFLFYAPFYQQIAVPETLEEKREQFIGIVYAPFIMERLMEGTLLNQNRLVNFSISDGDTILYDELNEESDGFDATPLFSQSVSAEIYGREWTYNIQTTSLFRQQYKNNQPVMILIGGIIIDLLLLGLFFVLARSNNKATALAVEMTKELRFSEERLNLTIDSMMDGLLTIDHRSKILSLNKTAESMFGFSADEAVGSNISMLMSIPGLEDQDDYLSDYVASADTRVIGIGRDVLGQRKDGSTFPMEMSVGKMTVADQRMFTAIVRDISERKMTERLKSEFVSTVSHELRTPLTSIRGALGLVLSKGAEHLPTKMCKMLEVAHRNSERLTLLINDILDLEKLETGQLEFEFSLIDLVALARHALEDNEGFARSHKVQLVLTTSLRQAYVHGDAHRLLQAFANLISNAIKYSPEGGEVDISIELNEKRYRVSIRDDGPGIPHEFRSRIFQRFAQADSSDTREKGGTGLGLSITKTIVERHDGLIDYDSQLGIGTQFYFELPAKEALLEDTCTAKADAHVLICEDDPDMAEILAHMVLAEGVNSDIAGTAEAARAMLATNDYRLLLLDLTLPDADGLELLQELRDRPDFSELPVIVVSARAKESKSLHGEALMMVDWLQKPIDENALRRATQHALNPLNQPRLLHVEDDYDTVQIARMVLEDLAEISHAPDLHEARRQLTEHQFDLILLDLELTDGSGAELLDEIQGRNIPVVIFSGQMPARLVTERVNAALTKSMTSNDQLRKTVRHILNKESYKEYHYE